VSSSSKRPNGCRDDHFGSQGRRCYPTSEISDQEGDSYTERRRTHSRVRGKEPCEPIPSRCPASTHVKGNAVNLRARKREKGSLPFNQEDRDDSL
jgi:hypothetical protein